MNIFIIIFRTIIYYFIILILFRIMGKRKISELSITDLVVSILIAEIASIGIENYEKSLLNTLLPIIIVVILEIILSSISMKSFKFRHIIDPEPSLIIKNSKLNFKEMERQRYSIDDLLTQLRDKGIKSIDEIEYAVLEKNGKLSVFKYDNKNIYPLPLILDGIVQYDTLKAINKNKIWLNKILKEEETTLDKVFYAFYKNNKCFIIKRNN